MAKTQREKQGKKTGLSTNGGIGGLVVLGGALAAAGLVAALKNRSKRRPNNNSIKNAPRNQIEDANCDMKEEIQGLRSLLQTPSTSAEKHTCEPEALRICSAPISSCGRATIENLIMEKESALNISKEEQKSICETNGTVLEKSETSVLETNNCDINKGGIPLDDIKGSMFPEMNLDALKHENAFVVVSKEDPIAMPSAETVTVIYEKVETLEEIMIAHVEETIDEGEAPSQDDDESVEEKDEDSTDVTGDSSMELNRESSDGTEDSSMELNGEGSDGTGDSSIESNAEAIWPAESLVTGVGKTNMEISGKKGRKEVEEAVECVVSKGTKKEYEERGGAKNAAGMKVIMEKEKPTGTLMMHMERTPSSALILRFCFILMVVGFAVLSYKIFCFLCDSSSDVVGMFNQF